MTPRRGTVLLCLFLSSGCSPAFVGFSAPCTLAAAMHPLPPAIHESSGVVPSSSEPGAFWTHNDSGGEPVLFAVDETGRLLGSVWVEGAENRDWEDLAIGPCDSSAPGGAPGRPCLYIADTGDNREARTDPAIYRVPEPTPGDERSAPSERFPLRFPDGPRDVEAIYLLPGERLFLVTKGRNHPVEVYRVPAPLPGAAVAEHAEEPLLLERIQTLTRGSPALPRHVTGGAATADGRLVALRTYETLQLYRPDAEGRLAPIPGGLVNLRPLREPQGEAVALVPGNQIVLTSESGLLGGLGTIARLSCPGIEAKW